MSRRHDAMWAGLATAALTLEASRLPKRHDGEGTLCDVTRRALHTDSKVGRWAFLLGWGLLAAWFPGHILNSPKGEDHGC